MKRIATTNAPAALGPYAQAVDTGDTVYCSGQLGLDPATGALAEGVQRFMQAHGPKIRAGFARMRRQHIAVGKRGRMRPVHYHGHTHVVRKRRDLVQIRA